MAGKTLYHGPFPRSSPHPSPRLHHHLHYHGSPPTRCVAPELRCLLELVRLRSERHAGTILSSMQEEESHDELARLRSERRTRTGAARNGHEEGSSKRGRCTTPLR